MTEKEKKEQSTLFNIITGILLFFGFLYFIRAFITLAASGSTASSDSVMQAIFSFFSIIIRFSQTTLPITSILYAIGGIIIQCLNLKSYHYTKNLSILLIVLAGLIILGDVIFFCLKGAIWIQSIQNWNTSSN